MNENKLRNGFTLVEVIVVAVIVGILSLIGVLLYMGYVKDSRRQLAEGLAASAAGFLNSAVNIGAAVPGPGIATPLTEAGNWTITGNSGGISVFKCPEGTILEIDNATKTVTSRYISHSIESEPYQYDE